MSEKRIKISLRPEEILSLPLVTKGTAFTQEERDALGLNGFLPCHVATVDEQIRRIYENLATYPTPLAKYVFLLGILNRNEHLFYQFAARHVNDIVPIIYTPTVGEAAVNYSQIYFRQRGLYLSYPLRDKLDEIFSHCPNKDALVIVATDGERVLGLGDQGIGGMTIPIGKLSLYTLFGGIHPSRVLPVFLDVGTNNQNLLKDELYLGWRHPRLTGAEYDLFIEQFVKAVKKWLPKTLLQWEDFGKNNARRLLEKYRAELLSFNDDIQGTATVTLGAILSAVHVAKMTLKEQRISILGGGSAGLGIADMLVSALCEEGLTEEEAVERIYIIDIDGLILKNFKNMSSEQKRFAKNLKDPMSLLEVVKKFHPTVLIGVSGQGGAFTEEMVKEMARHVPKPIILPLSNPTSKAEAIPDDIFHWTKGNAIVATGSPFPPVDFGGKKYTIAQCNNVYVFPGVGTGALAANAKGITDSMFLEAAKILSKFSPALKDPSSSLFPSLPDVRTLSRAIAIGVAKKAIREGISQVQEKEVEKRVDAIMWEPKYPTYSR